MIFEANRLKVEKTLLSRGRCRREGLRPYFRRRRLQHARGPAADPQDLVRLAPQPATCTPRLLVDTGSSSLQSVLSNLDQIFGQSSAKFASICKILPRFTKIARILIKFENGQKSKNLAIRRDRRCYRHPALIVFREITVTHRRSFLAR